MRQFLVAAAVLASVHNAAAAAVVGVTIVLCGDNISTNTPVEVSAHSVDAKHPDAVATIPAGALSASLDLSPGAWQIRAASAELFVPERSVLVSNPSLTVQMKSWKLGTVTARVEYDGPRPKVEKVRAYWSSENGREGLPNGDVPCLVVAETHTATCSVPVGTMSVRLRSEGFLSKLWPSVKVSPTSVLELGSVTFRHGAAIVGRAVKAIDVDSKQPIIVELLTDDYSSPRRIASSTTSEKGHFTLEGIEPGSYAVRARAGENQSELRVVRVRPNGESELIEPLVVSRPTQIRVSIDPPVDHRGQPWMVSLRSMRNTVFVASGVDRAAEANGQLDLVAVPGTYRVVVSRPGERHGIAFTDVVVKEGDRIISAAVRVQLTPVHGVVSLSGEPLSGLITFGGRASASATTVRSAADGTYDALVPLQPAAPWDVAVDSDVLNVHTSLSLSPEKVPDGNDYKLDIAVPSSQLSGKVVDVDGAPVVKAIVTIAERAAKEPTQVRTATDGTFAVRSLADGEYSIQAEAPGGRKTAVEVVRIADSADLKDVVLRVGKQQSMTIRVVTASGNGVTGARVFLFPEHDSSPVRVPCTTDEDGVCSKYLDADAGSVAVAIVASGFPFKTFRVQPRDAILNIAMLQDGGSLKAAMPAEFLRDTSVPVVLSHRMSTLPVLMLLGQGLGKVTPAADGSVVVELPLLEAGDYTICRRDACASATLAPYGTAQVALIAGSGGAK